jgi:Ricin-type beta-trefoil lectin domain
MRRVAVPLAKLPLEIVDAARNHLHMVAAGMATGEVWRGAELAPFAIALHRPDIEGPAYYELKVVRGSDSLGFIVVATGGHDTPVPEFKTDGPTKAEALVARANGKAHTLYRLDGAVLVAEGASGEIADATWPQIPIVPASDAKREGPVEMGSWAGWKTLKRDFTSGFEREIESQRKQSVEHWNALRSLRAATGADDQNGDVVARTWTDVYDQGPTTYECENNWAGPNAGSGDPNALTAKWDQLSGFRHILSGTPAAQCYSGCTPTGAAIVLAWIDEQSRRWDSGAWSRPEMGRAFFRYKQAVPIDHLPFVNYGYRAPYLPGAPFLQPANVYDYSAQPSSSFVAYDGEQPGVLNPSQDMRRYLTEIGMSMGTHCQGSSGNTHWNAIAGLQRFFDDHRIPVNVSTGSNPWGEPAFRDNIINALRSTGAPGFIHTGGWSGHTEVVNAHAQCRVRDKATGQVTWTGPSYFYTNKGWGGGNIDGWISVGNLMSSTTFSPKSAFVKLVPAHSGRCAEVPGGFPGVGLPMQQSSCSGNPNQRWNFIPQTDGSYLIRNMQTSMCLDTRGTNDNGIVDQWYCFGEPNQRWRAEIRPDGKFLLRSAFSNKCLEVLNASTGIGATIGQYYCDGVSSQVWDLAQ